MRPAAWREASRCPRAVRRHGRPCRLSLSAAILSAAAWLPSYGAGITILSVRAARRLASTKRISDRITPDDTITRAELPLMRRPASGRYMLHRCRCNPIEKTAVIENNLIQHSMSRQEYKASVGQTTVFLTGNRRRVGDSLQNYPNLVPTTGLWNAGQRVFFDRQEPDGAIGAICTQTGVPGQWRKLKQDLP
jgi:hypothetical protein